MSLDQQRRHEFTEYVTALMTEAKAPGMAVCITEQDSVVYSQGFGSRNQEGSPATDTTIFGVASVTKTFTGLAVTQLWEQGKLAPEDPVRQYLPDFDVPGGGGDRITVHHLLNHTSGLPPIPALGCSITGNTVRDTDDDQPPVDMPSVNTHSDLVKYIRDGDFRMLGAPGEHCSYSNDGYALLGAIVERVSGQTYDAYLHDHVLAPLGMTRSTFSLEDTLRDGDVTALYYKNEQGEVICSPNWQVAPPYLACGWLKSTAADLAHCAMMFANGGQLAGRRLISSDKLAEMVKRTHRYSRDTEYGYGLSVRRDYEGATLISHNGSLKGVSSVMGFIPEANVGVSALCNLTGAPIGKVWAGAVNLMLGLPIDRPLSRYESAGAINPETRAFCSGHYKSGEGAELSVEPGQVGLVVKFGEETHALTACGQNLMVVRLPGGESELRFLDDGSGRAWAVWFGGRVIARVD